VVRADLREAAQRQIQHLADRVFGAGTVRVECTDIRLGSLEFKWVVLAVGASFQFLKEYDKVRAGSLRLAADVKAAAGALRRQVRKLIDPDNPFRP
jgi:hypothetical protein